MGPRVFATQEPFHGPYLLIDSVRIVVAAVALWMVVLLVRLAYARWRHPRRDDERPHWAVSLSYAILLFIVAVRRIEHLGQTPPWTFYASIVAVVLGIYGLSKRVQFRLSRVFRWR